MVAAATAPGGGRRNHPQHLKSGLSASRRQLVELMQDINFGRLEELAIRGAEPVLDPPPAIVREIKFGGDNGPRPERRTDDFLLKSEVLELFGALDDLGDGVVNVLEIKHGLPFRMSLREPAA